MPRTQTTAPFLAHLQDFGLDSPSATGNGTVGDRIAREQAARIHDRGLRAVGSEGAWEMNAESTARRKGFNAPNIETGEMLDEKHIAGEVSSSHGEMVMTYGQGTPDADGTTDRDRAYYAHHGQSRKRIKRPFFGIREPEDPPAIVETIRQEWQEYHK